MAQLIVITHPGLAPGFQLAGVTTFAAENAEAARRRLIELMDEGEAGIIALDQPYLESLDLRTRRRIEQGYRPVVIGLPTGHVEMAEARRRRQLAELIRRAIGVRITFGGGE
jgi:vacuolar-type H+-ATPase subunit F/Vma7